MSRKNGSPEKQACRAKIRELPQASNTSSMDDIQNLFKETITEIMKNGLEPELDEERGYSKYIGTRRRKRERNIMKKRGQMTSLFHNVIVKADNNLQ